jgi:tetratricopeptide (TPR) repeat protein
MISRRRTSEEDGDGDGSDALEDDVRTIMEGVFGRALGSMASGLAEELRTLLDADRHEDAAEAFREGQAVAKFGRDGLCPLLDQAVRISTQALPAALRDTVHKGRLALAAELGVEERAEEDARALLATTRDPVWTAALETYLGVALMRRGLPQAAIARWRGIDLNAASAGNRAWVQRNIANALPPDDPEALVAAKASTDAFLEAGNAREAVTGQLLVCDLLAHGEVVAVLDALDGCAALMSRPGIIGDLERAHLDQELAGRYAGLHEWTRAFEAAGSASDRFAGLRGGEESWAASLNLQAIAAEKLSRPEQAATLKRRAKAVSGGVGSAYFAIADQVPGLMDAYDDGTAQALLARAGRVSDDLVVKLEFVMAKFDPSLGDLDRVERLEGLRERAERLAVDSRTTSLISVAMADILRLSGRYPQAADVLNRLLRADPANLMASDLLIDMLLANGAWSEAAVALEVQRARHGDSPERLFKLGKALLEDGDASRAASALVQCRRMGEWTGRIALELEDLVERALASAGTVSPWTPPKPDKAPILREAVEAALAEFSKFVSADKRPAFWREMSADKPKWTPSPEALAQNLLHSSLNAKFGEDAEIIEEWSSGAGRLDLFVKFRGGLKVIIELKMCGPGYASTYAGSGEIQLDHYMSVRGVHLGYLVVVDGRIDDVGKSVLPRFPIPGCTVKEVLVDVSPRVRRRRSQV